VEVPVTNPLATSLILKAEYGHLSLTGAKTFSLEGNQSSHFVFYFAPLVAGQGKSFVKLLHPDVGEFWYQVHHSAIPGGPVELPPMAGPVGVTAEAKFAFVNPLDKPLQFRISCSHSSFAAASNILNLRPLEARDTVLFYTARTLNKVEEASITIENKVKVSHLSVTLNKDAVMPSACSPELSSS
jgi:hypothetical protein